MPRSFWTEYLFSLTNKATTNFQSNRWRNRCHNLSHICAELHLARGATSEELSCLTWTAKTRKKLPGYRHGVKGKCQLCLYGLQVCVWVCVLCMPERECVWSVTHECSPRHPPTAQWAREAKRKSSSTNTNMNQWTQILVSILVLVARLFVEVCIFIRSLYDYCNASYADWGLNLWLGWVSSVCIAVSRG